MGNFSQITSTDVLVYQLTGAASVKSFCETHTPKHIILLITLSRLILLFYVCVCVCVGWSCIIQLASEKGSLRWEWKCAPSREAADEIADTGRISRGLLGERAPA